MSLDTNSSQIDVEHYIGSAHIAAMDEAMMSVTTDDELLDYIAASFRSLLNADAAVAFLYDTPLPARPQSVGLLNDALLHLDGHEQVMIATRRAIRGRSAHEPSTLLYVPLQSETRLLGAARLGSPKSPAGFTPADAGIATAFGRIAGRRLYHFHMLRRLRLLSEVSERLSNAPDADRLYAQTFELASQALSVDGFFIGLLDQSRQRLNIPFAASPGRESLSVADIPLGGGPASVAIASGQTQCVSGVPGLSESPAVVPEGMLDGCLSAIYAPLIAGSTTYGVLSVQAAQRYFYAADEVAAVATIARAAAVALERLVHQEASRKRLERMSLLNGVSQAVNSTLDLGQTCLALDRELQRAVPSHDFAIAIVQPSGSEIPFSIIHARESESYRHLELNKIVTSHAQTAITTALPQVVSLLSGSAAPLSVALIPMLGDKHSTGVLVLTRETSPPSEPWEPAELELLVPVANVAARAIELARLHETVEQDRLRMARLASWQQALMRGSDALTHTGDVTRLIDTIAAELETLLPHRSLAVYVVDEDPHRLTTIRVREGGAPVDVTMSLSIGQGIVGAAVLDGLPLLVNSSHRDERSFYPEGDPADTSHGENLVAAPLVVSGGTIGAVAISREGSRPFTLDEFQAFTSFIPHFALVINTGRLVARNRATHISAIRALTATIDAKDPLTRGHSDRVARYARQIAAEMMLPAEEQEAIELAALLHDIGKIGVPDDILSKPGPLNASERAIMMEHAALGAEILRGANGHEISQLIPLVRHHHEWYQGGGYPDGISGDDIPLGAAIIAVADAFDTMTTNRPYRAAMPVSAALEEARRNASTQFHPLAVDALTSTIETSSLSFDTANSFIPSQSAVTHITPVDVRPVSVLYRIAREIASIGDVDGFLRKVVRIISEELRYPSVSILLPDAAGTGLVIRADVWTDPSGSLTGQVVPIDSSLCGWVFQTGRVVNVGDTHKDTRFYPPGLLRVRSELAAPLTVDGSPIGVLNAESEQPHAFSGIDERLFVAISSQLAPAVQLAQVHDDIKRAAQRDGLTGIYNHASFYSRLEELLSDGQRIALFIFDVEGLKRINDTAGHLAGDSALRRVATTLDLETRTQDIVARYGGDEFAVIVTDVDEATALEMASRLQAAVRRLTWGANSEPMSISVGVALSGRDGNKATDLVEIADRRMYAVRALERAGVKPQPRRRDRRADTV